MDEAPEAELGSPDSGIDWSPLDELLPALRRLDGLIARAVAAVPAAHGPEAAGDPYRGLYISREEVARLLSREPGTPTLWRGADAADDAQPEASHGGSPLALLQRAFGLSPLEVDVVLIALAPELDLRYERLYAYLQDDVTRKRPTVDLALNLLCASAGERLAYRAHFAPDAPLLHHRLLHLIPDPHQVEPPLLAHYLQLHGQIVRFLLGGEGLDPRLAPFCKLVWSDVLLDEVSLPADARRALAALAHESWQTDRPLRLYFQGPLGVGKRRTAEALAAELSLPLLAADLARGVARVPDLELALKTLFREAWFTGAVLCLDALDALRGEEHALRRPSGCGPLLCNHWPGRHRCYRPSC